MEKISFELFGLTLLEPLSSLMNWVLAVQCFIFYRKLKNATGPFQVFWKRFFLLYSLSLLFGGLSHLLFNYTGMWGKIPNWTLAIFGNAMAEMAFVAGIKDPKKQQQLQAAIWSLVLATIVLLMYDLNFKWVMLHTFGLFIIIGFHSIRRMRAGRAGYSQFLIGMGFLLLMAPVKIGQLDLHPSWFTRDDLAHLLMLGLYWMLFRGAKEVGRDGL